MMWRLFFSLDPDSCVAIDKNSLSASFHIFQWMCYLHVDKNKIVAPFLSSCFVINQFNLIVTNFVFNQAFLLLSSVIRCVFSYCTVVRILVGIIMSTVLHSYTQKI